MPSQREGTASHRLQHAWRPSSCESTSELRQYKLLIPTEISRDVHLPLSSAFAVWPQSESRRLQRYSECRRATYVCSSSWLGMPASSQAFPRLGTHPRIARALIVVGRRWHIHMRQPFAWWPVVRTVAIESRKARRSRRMANLLDQAGTGVCHTRTSFASNREQR